MSLYNCNNRSSCGCNSCSNVLGTNTCGCNNSNSNNACSCNHHYPFPPFGAVAGTCPAGTRPCNMCSCNVCGCRCNGGCCNTCGCNNCGCNNHCTNGTYAFFNSTGSTITTGSVIPLRYVIGSGTLGRGTTGGIVNLDCGIYSVEYSLNATADTAGAVITVTPEYLGALHPEYSRTFTTTAADQSFELAGAFVINLPQDTTLSLNVTITEPEGATTTTTLTDVNSSMLIRCIG